MRFTDVVEESCKMNIATTESWAIVFDSNTFEYNSALQLTSRQLDVRHAIKDTICSSSDPVIDFIANIGVASEQLEDQCFNF